MIEPGGHPPTLLIVDDEPSNLALLASVLQPHFRVRAANGGLRALRAATTEPTPDLILLDVMMPELDGHAVLERLKRDPVTAGIPVIFITALESEEDEQRGLAAGAVDFITKPVRPPIVLARVRTQLALKEARDRLAAQNAWLEAEVERRTRDNLIIQDVALSVLAGLVETRDLDTGAHTLRTQAYVEALGRSLRATPGFEAALRGPALALIVKAAPLHDIGKVGIPDAILLKPGPLTAAEFAVMKTHAPLGADAIAHALGPSSALGGPPSERRAGPLAFLETARKMARWHHERWDGKGYPDGLVGDAIPVCARLMAVADVFDALTTRRVYKAAMSAEDAGEILRQGRGTQFDPDVIDAFEAVAPEFADIVARYGDVP